LELETMLSTEWLVSTRHMCVFQTLQMRFSKPIGLGISPGEKGITRYTMSWNVLESLKKPEDITRYTKS
jgi:hypothetical protein